MPTLNWIGKDAVINHHLEVPFHLLKDVPELGCGDPGSGNLIVEGDNLVALKALLPYYKGKVKCICIDPPYNTGNEGWAYNDNVNSPAIRKWIGDTVGGEGETLDRHDRWLCMMYPRLALLREFLSEDGSIWVALDDNEIHGLRYIMNEVFGAQNFVGTVVWEKSDSPKMDAQYFSSRHDYLVCYAKRIDLLTLSKMDASNTEVAEHYNRTDDEGRLYYTKPLRAMGGQGDSREARPTLYYPLTAPDGCAVYPKKQDGTDKAWRWKADKVAAELKRIDWVKGRRGGWTPYFRIYADSSAKRPAETIWFHAEAGSNRTSKTELKAVFPENDSFATPKPTRLIERILQIATNPGDLVLDSFAGSGTTGHAVLKMSAAAPEGGARRFILVEMDEQIAPDITRERVRRVAEGYTNAKGEAVVGLGGGFRYVRLGDQLFDEHGRINETKVRFADLARHVYFSETGEPLPKERISAKTPLLGVHHGRAIYLLYNGILKDKSIGGGNALCRETLQAIEEINASHEGIAQTVVYGTSQRLSPARLKRNSFTFKQIPYHLRIS